MVDTETTRDALRGVALQEKLASIGVEHGRMVEIRNLDAIGRDYGIDVYLFFEKDLAATRTLDQVEDEFQEVPEFERPYVKANRFLQFTEENDPSFTHTLDTFLLMIEIVGLSERRDPITGCSIPVITGMMPFLDEFDVDIDPAQRRKNNSRGI